MATRAKQLFAVAAASVVLAAPSSAHAVTVEKIVAIVGDDAILLSELDARAYPFKRQIAKQYPTQTGQRAGAESQMRKDLLTRMIEETLEAQAAERAKVVISPEELDKAFVQLAGQQKMTVDQLFEMTEEKTGLTETEYRSEIRRQLLEGKLISQRVRGRIRVTEEDLKNTFKKAVRDERDRRQYRPAWLALRILPNSSQAAIDQRIALAKSIHERLLAGEDFATLVSQYSDDTDTRDKGGDLGVRAPIKSPAVQAGKRQALSQELEDKVLPLEKGEYTAPFRAGDAIVIMTILSREPSRYTTFEAARDEMVQRVQNEILAREKVTYLEELKKRTYVKESL